MNINYRAGTFFVLSEDKIFGLLTFQNKIWKKDLTELADQNLKNKFTSLSEVTIDDVYLNSIENNNDLNILGKFKDKKIKFFKISLNSNEGYRVKQNELSHFSGVTKENFAIQGKDAKTNKINEQNKPLDLSFADLSKDTGLPLHYANLESIDFFCADLTRVNFTCATNFSNKKIEGANMQEVIGFAQDLKSITCPK